MKQILVLGSGCTKCNKTAEVISKTAEQMNIDVNVEKETNPEVMMQYGVMGTPAVVIDQALVHSGSIPHHDQIEDWLKK